MISILTPPLLLWASGPQYEEERRRAAEAVANGNADADVIEVPPPGGPEGDVVVLTEEEAVRAMRLQIMREMQAQEVHVAGVPFLGGQGENVVRESNSLSCYPSVLRAA